MTRTLPRILLFCGFVAIVTPAGSASAAVHKAVIDAPINAIQVDYVSRAIDQAEREGSELFVLVLNTPGGLADSMEGIISRILVSKVPVCVFVYPPGSRAASAGFFILMSGDIAAMAPGTRAGAAHPVLAIGGIIPVEEPSEGDKEEQKKGRHQVSTLLEKVKQDAMAFLRAIVERRGRNPKAAELAVTESRSYSDQEALQQGLIEIVAANEADLLAKLNGRVITRLDGEVKVLNTAGAAIVSIEKTFREKALEAITNPNVAFLLAVVGAILLYVEITHAGMILPGVIGGILLLLAIMGFSYLPINATGVLLVLAGLGLFIAEVFVQSFGLLGLAGAVCLALGAIMLVDLPEKDLSVDPFLAVGAAVGLALISVFLMSLAVRALRRRPVTGLEGLVGLEGIAVTPLEPTGKVLIRGEYWQAEGTHPLPSGTKVRCIGVKGLVLRVEALQPAHGGGRLEGSQSEGGS